MNDAPSSPEAAAAPLPLGGAHGNIFADPAAMRLTPPPAVELARVAAPFLARVFSDAAGNPSSLRVILVFGFGAVAIAWAYLSIQAGALQEIPMTVISFLALLVGGKLWQNGQEPGTVPPLYKISNLSGPEQTLAGAGAHAPANVDTLREPGAAGSGACPAAPKTPDEWARNRPFGDTIGDPTR